MFNKSKKTAFSTVNVDELLISEGAEVNHEAEADEPAPVVEKVTLKEIREEKKAEDLSEIDEMVKEYLELTPEEKAALKKALFG